MAGKARKTEHSRPPYGFVYIDGNLVKHPVEQKRIEVIVRLAGAGQKSWRIKEELQKLKVPPRTGKAWCHKTIQKVIDREAAKIYSELAI